MKTSSMCRWKFRNLRFADEAALWTRILTGSKVRVRRTSEGRGSLWELERWTGTRWVQG